MKFAVKNNLGVTVIATEYIGSNLQEITELINGGTDHKLRTTISGDTVTNMGMKNMRMKLSAGDYIVEIKKDGATSYLANTAAAFSAAYEEIID